MELGNTYFGLRHGESQANAASEIAWDPARAVAGFGLTPAGREGVERGLRAADLPRAPLIVSSDLRRARETAEIARAVLEAPPVRLDPRLRERVFGQGEGGTNLLYDVVWAEDPLDPSRSRWCTEPVADLAARIMALLRELETEARGRTVLLVAHGDPLQVLRAVLSGHGPGAHRHSDHWKPGEVARLA